MKETVTDYLVSFPALGINDLAINRVAFSIGSIHIYWYGILIAAAVMLCIFLATKEGPRFGMSQDYIMDTFLVLIPSMIIGARLYYVIFSWDSYKDNWLSIFDTRKGGLAFYGGVIGGIIGYVIYHVIKKKSIERFLDFIVVYVPLGQAIGRIGNFINQEAFGTNTTMPWGMISNGTRDYLSANPALGQNPDLPVHPTFLYEFVGNMILFFILHKFRKNNKVPYGTVALYLAGYGFVRFFVEGIRTDALYIGGSGIRVSQLLSLLMVLGAVVYLVLLRHRKRQSLQSEENAIFEAAAQTLNGEPSVQTVAAEAAVLDSEIKEDKAAADDEKSSVEEIVGEDALK